MTKYHLYKINNSKKSQIFYNIPSIEWVNKFLEDCFGIKDFDEYHIICKSQFEKIFNKYVDYLPEFTLYIRNYYLNQWFVIGHMSFRRCMTIMKNIVGLYGYNICYSVNIKPSNQENHKLEKELQYRVYKIENIKPVSGINIRKNVIMHFD